MYFTKLRKGEKVSNAVLPWPGINVPLKEREIEILVFAHKKTKCRPALTTSGTTLTLSTSTFIQWSPSCIFMNLLRENQDTWEPQILFIPLEAFLFNFDLALKDFSMSKQQMWFVDWTRYTRSASKRFNGEPDEIFNQTPDSVDMQM